MRDYTWIAIYKDGDFLLQYDTYTKIENSTEHINRANLKTFILQGHFGPILTIHFDPGDCFLYRRRTEMSSGSSTRIGHIMLIKRPYKHRRVVINDPDYEDNFVQHGFIVIQPLEEWNIPTIESFGDFRAHQWWYAVQESWIEKQQVGC